MNGRNFVRWLLVTRSGGVLMSSVVAAVTSVGVTYAVVNKRLEKKYSDISDHEIEVARQFYRKMAILPVEPEVDEEDGIELEDDEDEDIITQSSAVSQAIKIMAESGYTPYNQPDKIAAPVEEVVEVTASIQKNLWDDQKQSLGIDLKEAAQQKAMGRPYLISEDEHDLNELEWTQRQVTWFEGDDVLADETEEHMPEVDRLIDLGNLQFGVGTKDSNMVYVANPQTQEYYEITRSFGSYAHEVLGHDLPEPRNKTVYKMRPDM